MTAARDSVLASLACVDRDARAIILRRRARFLASTLGGLASFAIAPVALATESGNVVMRSSVGQCIANASLTHAAMADIVMLLEEAKVLHRKGDRAGALVAVQRARRQAFLADVAEMEARLEADAGHYAAARALLEARTQCPEAAPVEGPVAAQLEDLKSRTAEITVAGARHIKIDGVLVGSGSAQVFVDAGSYVIEIDTFDGVTSKRTLAFAGGETEQIEVPGGEPRVCLSIMRERREDVGPIGITVSPTMMIDISPPEGGPLTVGGSIAPFGRLPLSSSIEVRAGAVVTPSGSSRGFTMPIGGWTSLRVYPGGLLSVGIGSAVGYLVTPSPSRATIGSFEPRPSAYVEPHIPITVTIGSIEIENKIGMVICGQEDGERSRFALTYTTFSLGLTWLPMRRSRFDE